MAGKANTKLLRGVLEPRKPGALDAIVAAIEAGADPDAVTSETNTSNGHVPAGRTLLTHAVHEEATKVVKRLLEGGADPSLLDALGWTPWMASTLVDESKRDHIQTLLRTHGADESGAQIGELARAVYDGDLQRVRSMDAEHADFQLLNSFRVDLLGRQVGAVNIEMLEYLLANGMSSSSTNLVNAVRFETLDAVKVLLEFGQPPEIDDELETPLMTAARLGNQPIVELLVEAGADVNRRYTDDDGEWTPAQCA
ncbi:MAG: ankyrin repeat domain-containing protein, partial [Pseudomonadota bacterium]